MNDKTVFLDGSIWTDFKSACSEHGIALRAWINEAVRMAIENDDFFEDVTQSYQNRRNMEKQKFLEQSRLDAEKRKEQRAVQSAQATKAAKAADVDKIAAIEADLIRRHPELAEKLTKRLSK